MRSKIFGLVAAVSAVFAAASAQATTVTLDFDTAATGGQLVADGSVTTSLGTVSLTCAGYCTNSSGTMYHDQQGNDGNSALLDFGFEVSMLVFDYAGNAGGVFTAQALDANGDIVDSFFDSSTSNFLPGTGDGTVSLFGSGITALRFMDGPNGGNYSVIDNLQITGTSAVPLPASLPMLGAGLVAIGAVRRRRRS